MSHALPVDAPFPQFARPAIMPDRSRIRGWAGFWRSWLAARLARPEAAPAAPAAPSSLLRAELVGLGADRLLFAIGVILALAMAGWLFGTIISPAPEMVPVFPQL